MTVKKLRSILNDHNHRGFSTLGTLIFMEFFILSGNLRKVVELKNYHSEYYP